MDSRCLKLPVRHLFGCAPGTCTPLSSGNPAVSHAPVSMAAGDYFFLPWSFPLIDDPLDQRDDQPLSTATSVRCLWLRTVPHISETIRRRFFHCDTLNTSCNNPGAACDAMVSGCQRRRANRRRGHQRDDAQVAHQTAVDHLFDRANRRRCKPRPTGAGMLADGVATEACATRLAAGEDSKARTCVSSLRMSALSICWPPPVLRPCSFCSSGCTACVSATILQQNLGERR